MQRPQDRPEAARRGRPDAVRPAPPAPPGRESPTCEPIRRREPAWARAGRRGAPSGRRPRRRARRRADRASKGLAAGLADQPLAFEGPHHVVDALADRRALADQVVGPARPRIERRAGHGQHLAALLVGQPGGDQRSRAHLGLDHHHGRGEARDQPVAAREVLGLGAGGPAGSRRRCSLRRRSADAGRRARADRGRRRRRPAPRRCRSAARPHAPRRRRRAPGPRPPDSPPRRDRRPGCGRTSWPAAEAIRAPTTAMAGRCSGRGVAEDPDQRRRRIERRASSGGKSASP